MEETSLPYPDYTTSLRITRSPNTLSMENSFFDLELDPEKGACLSSIREKSTGREFLEGPGNDVVVWKDLGGLYRLGHEMHPAGLEEIFSTSGSSRSRVEVLENGPVRVRVSVETPWIFPIRREVALMEGVNRIEASSTLRAPLETAFTVRFPTGIKQGALTMALPYGEVTREEEKVYQPTFWPGIEWADLSVAGQDGGFTLTALGSRGWRYSGEGLLECMLHRNALMEFPDILGPPGTDSATHTIRYALSPASGGSWIERRSWMQARAFNAPLRAAFTGIHGGPLPLSRSIASLDDPRAELTTMKRPETGEEALYLRIFRRGENPVTTTLTIGLPGTWKILTADASETQTGRPVGTSPAVRLRLEKRLTTLKLVP